MNAGRSARERVRAELTREIKEVARHQLAAEGASHLSLRAVARELGMVSSALYRYFPSRDELLTALIIDAYEALGETAEAAAASPEHGDLLDRWRAVCRSIRRWALEHPHEYALVYGSPVPGYRAPTDTIVPAARAVTVLLGLLAAAWEEGRIAPPADVPPLQVGVAGEMERLAAQILPGVDAATTFRMLVAWTQLLGMVSFELFGHSVGVLERSDLAFDAAVVAMARYVGLVPARSSSGRGPGHGGRVAPRTGGRGNVGG
ncbi:MAG TPA: TetR/AcrR family transcriptional regulator [Acidimicrobiales bacterium]|nr:TetR/AcrR family transcriptional regulator [Acidimicrobiales bacterium]